MHFLFPSDPIDPQLSDEAFREQADELRKLGIGTSIVALDELGQKNCRLRGPIPSDATVVYRGWMLTPTEYEALLQLIHSRGAVPLISLEKYLLCHYLPNWYPLISEFTAETRVFSANADLANELRALGWQKFFIKDFVKSLKTSVGSVIADPEDITLVVSEMKKFRGEVLAYMHGVSDRAGSWHTLRWRCTRYCLPTVSTASASRSTGCFPSREWISRLNTRPIRPPANASTPPSRAAPHDSGPLWFARPSTYEAFIHNTLPV